MNDVYKKIDRYLKKENIGPLIVDVQNKSDLESLVTHYSLPGNTFLCASDSAFCKTDAFPSMETLLYTLTTENKNFFIRELSSFYKLKGERALLQALQELLALATVGHVIAITYQCADFLQEIMGIDKRLENRICIVEGSALARPKLVFASKAFGGQEENSVVKGISGIARAVETEISDTLYVETGKDRKDFPFSLYAISDLKKPYSVLCNKDTLTAQLPESIGSESDWQYVLEQFETYPSWDKLISAKIGSTESLGSLISVYVQNKDDKRWTWLYFVGLKLFGVGSGAYLQGVVKNANTIKEFVQGIYRLILSTEHSNPAFLALYDERKKLLAAIGNPLEETVDFCKIVQSKEQNAIYYLTDGSRQEKELLFKLLDKYGLAYERSELLNILSRVYPALWQYLQPYHFKNELLDSYFQEYKMQKMLNKIFHEFLAIVEEQAVKREYNLILQPRSGVVDKIEKANAQTYFTDAMGVEYLGYIMGKCHELGLMAKVAVARAELPSITSRNKEFWEALSTEKFPIITKDKIDKIKHHGEEDFDYSRADGKLPIHLIRELEIIDELLEQIKVKLTGDVYDKAILISDHGASRLAVIHETENLVEMESAGKHSGRCCPKSEVDEQPPHATDADDFWALANYDRFKGSRKANVEVHGGATLEEVVVPIIEITMLKSAVEVRIMPVDENDTFGGIPVITVSFRKKAAIKIFATQKLMDVSVAIDGHIYEAKPIDDNFYVVEEMPEIRQAKKYSVDVLSCGNKVATALPLLVKKEGSSEKNLL